MVKSDNLAPQKARLNFHQGILNSMLFNLFRPMICGSTSLGGTSLGGTSLGCQEFGWHVFG